MLNRWHSLSAHPDHSPKSIKILEVQLSRVRDSHVLKKDRLMLQFRADCALHELRLSPPRPPLRRDGLWQTTCCELFIKGEGESYTEYNFAPTSEWAAYRFSGYRQNDGWLEFDEPPMVIGPAAKLGYFRLDAIIRLDRCDELIIGLSAIIEEIDGTKSYWALAHPPGPPDFHHPDCFALTLGPPEHS
jgi:hypothetical protein